MSRSVGSVRATCPTCSSVKGKMSDSPSRSGTCISISLAPWLMTLALMPLPLTKVKASTGLPPNVPKTERLIAMTGGDLMVC